MKHKKKPRPQSSKRTKTLHQLKLIQKRYAISVANGHAFLIKFFLVDQIDDVTVEAQLKANETATKVDVLFEELNKLQKNVLKNEFEAKEIQDQSEKVYEAANKAHEGAVKVKTSQIYDGNVI